MSVRIELTDNAKEIIRQVQDFQSNMAQGVARAMHDQNQQTIAYISERKMRQRGPTTLGVVSRTLSRSLRSTNVRVSTSGVESSIGTNVKYAGAHEFGTKPFTIRPRTAKVLRFATPRGVVFARMVKHPGLPARRPIGSGIEERAANYSEALSKAIEEAWSK